MQTLRAISLMILSMALLALSDLFVKLSAQVVPLGQIILFLSVGGSALFLLYAALKRERLWRPEVWHPMVLLRLFFEIVASVGLIFGIANVPLTTFAAITQAAPIIVVMGGALFLGEQVGWRRWAAVLAGMLGMLIVIRPGGEDFNIFALYAVMGVAGLAGRDLVTRLAPAHLSSLTLSTWGFMSTIPVGLALLVLAPQPMSFTGAALLPLTLMTLVTAAGYFCITTAMRMAPVSIVAPFRYTRLIFTTALGLVFLGETLDWPTVIGATIILIAGLYTFLRERRLALQEARAGT